MPVSAARMIVHFVQDQLVNAMGPPVSAATLFFYFSVEMLRGNKTDARALAEKTESAPIAVIRLCVLPGLL